MDRASAIKKLRRILGPKAIWRVYEKPSSPENREAARVEAARLQAECVALEKRRGEIIAAMPEIQEIDAQLKEIYKPQREAQSYRSYYRYHVGLDIGIGMEVKAEGDSWEDIFRALVAKKLTVDRPNTEHVRQAVMS